MFELNNLIKEEIRKISLENSPKESGGLFIKNKLGKLKLIYCENVSPEPEFHYLISDEDLEKAKKGGQIFGYWHSHLKENELSQADIVVAEKLNINSIVYCIEKDQFHIYEPIGFEMPYVGRRRYYGVLDCLTLVMDYYQRELNINIPYISHPIFKGKDFSWINTINPEEFLIIGKDFLVSNGFKEIERESLQKHDLIVIQVEKFRIPTHFGIYLDNNRFLHQLDDVSDISIYGKYWRNRTKLTYRHSALL